MQSYIGGVFDEHELGTPNQPINHAVTLIGWDDDKGAWLIKNSWGQAWGGQAGFGRSSYVDRLWQQQHRLRHAWVRLQGDGPSPTPPVVTRAVVELVDFRNALRTE